LFGLSSLPGSWLEALGIVARLRDVELYLLSPSNQYWADLGARILELPGLHEAPRDELPARLRREDPDDRLGDAGHPLLVSWGRVARDAQILLAGLPDGYRDV